MRLFKTRYEVQQLRKEVQDFREMLVIHFGIKYTMQDFATYSDRHPNEPTIPVTDGEWWHYGAMLGRMSVREEPMPSILFYRSTKLEIK